MQPITVSVEVNAPIELVWKLWNNHPGACGPNAERWAAKLPVAVYAIDDQTALKVIDQQVEVISEGIWKLFGRKTNEH